MSIHVMGGFSQSRAISFSLRCQWAIARKNASRLSALWLESTDLFNEQIASSRFPARYWAMPGELRYCETKGSSATAADAARNASGKLRTSFGPTSIIHARRF